jgi:hypothetical protein
MEYKNDLAIEQSAHTLQPSNRIFPIKNYHEFY